MKGISVSVDFKETELTLQSLRFFIYRRDVEGFLLCLHRSVLHRDVNEWKMKEEWRRNEGLFVELIEMFLEWRSWASPSAEESDSVDTKALNNLAGRCSRLIHCSWYFHLALSQSFTTHIFHTLEIPHSKSPDSHLAHFTKICDTRFLTSKWPVCRTWLGQLLLEKWRFV